MRVGGESLLREDEGAPGSREGGREVCETGSSFDRTYSIP